MQSIRRHAPHDRHDRPPWCRPRPHAGANRARTPPANADATSSPEESAPRASGGPSPPRPGSGYNNGNGPRRRTPETEDPMRHPRNHTGTLALALALFLAALGTAGPARADSFPPDPVEALRAALE